MHNQNCVGAKLERPEMPPTRRTRELSRCSLHRFPSYSREDEGRGAGVGAAEVPSQQQASDRSKKNFTKFVLVSIQVYLPRRALL